MACVLTQSLSLDCRDSVGGVKEVYFIEFANASSITKTAGVVTAITKASGTRFRKYSLPPQTATATENIAGDTGAGTVVYNQEISIFANKLEASKRNEILLLAKNKLMAIVVDNNGKGWLHGEEDGVYLNGGSAATGGQKTERNGYNMVFSGSERELALEVNTATIATLETPGT